MHLNPKGQVCSLKTPFYPLLLLKYWEADPAQCGDEREESVEAWVSRGPGIFETKEDKFWQWNSEEEDEEAERPQSSSQLP